MNNFLSSYRVSALTLALIATSHISQANTLTINNGGFLKTNGQAVLNGRANASGELFPEQSLGCLSLTSLALTSDAVINQNLAGLYIQRNACQQYNQLTVSDSVNLGNANLSINLLTGATTRANSDSNRYGTTLINNIGSKPILGTFGGIREGGAIRVNNEYFVHVTYFGGDGNDVYIWRWDDDNDGIGNASDIFDDNPSEWLDSDGDGVGDNGDQLPNNAAASADSDGDGVADSLDAFPNHPLETVDSDGDGIGDNRDAFPHDANEHTDSDGDGIGDNAETDKDNDGIEDSSDICPLNSDVSQLDSDGDGVGDACDIDNDGDGLIDIKTLKQLFNIRFNLNGTGYSDYYTQTTSSCGNGTSVTQCSGYELLNDLDFDQNGDGELNDQYNQGQGWLPIGNSNNRFSAVFEGNGFHIKNLTINNNALGSNVGFFGAISSAKIRNLHFSGDLTQVNAKASNVGGIVGSATTGVEFNQVSFSGRVSTSNFHKYLGGLLGNAGQARIYDSHAKVTITGGLEYIGGLAGASNTAFVERNYTSVSITTTGSKVGGLLGARNHNWVQNNYSQGDITSIGNDIGGLIGSASSSVYDSFSTVNVSGNNAVGGLIGHSIGAIRRSYSIGKVIANHNIGGLAADFDNSTDTDSYWDSETSLSPTSAAGNSATTSDLQSPVTNSGLFANWQLTEWDFGTDKQYPALIFNGLVYRDTDNDGLFDYQDGDDDNDGVADSQDSFPFDASESIDTDGDGIGNNADTDDDNDGVLDFYDAFPVDANEQYDPDNDGIGSNTDTDDDNDGLFDSADNCPAVSNIDQADRDDDSFGDACDIDNDADGLIEISSLAALNNIRNNLAGTGYHNGNIEVSASCGDGVVVTECRGYELTRDLDFDENGDGIANDSFNQGEGWQPIAGAFTGVFEGNNYQILNLTINNTSLNERVAFFALAKNAYIRNVHFTGNVTGQAERLAGVIGSATQLSEFHHVSFIGNVTATIEKDYLGGLIGYMSQGNVTSSRFVGKVTGGNNHVGGLVGFKAWGNLRGSYSQGEVSATGDRVGGLVGSSWNGKTDYNYSTAKVSGANYVGGIIGFFSGSNVRYNYALGEVSGSTNVGNLVGRDALSRTSDSYWNRDIAIQADNGVGTGHSTAEMQSPTDSSGIYQNWGSDYWDYGQANQYPALILAGITHRDSDGDKVFDQLDAFAYDSSEWLDTDGDGIGNNGDADDDNDGLSDSEEVRIGTDPLDKDSDNDGIEDGQDDLPLDASDNLDTDRDGIGNNRDTDDDNDGVVDSEDAFPLDNTESVDTDGDGIGNNRDSDDDNDGVVDSEDAFPLDNTESVDTDRDGIGNNRDTDDDNDGVVDSDDAFPLDNIESVDTDGDGIGNNRDSDDDNDSIVDSEDAFPLDNSESVDTDRDGIGNNRDTDDDNDGVVDSEDAFPLDVTESVDSDGDGIGNNRDTDDDNDGVVDSEDAFPLDNSESVDTDRDGIGNNRDTDDDNDGVVDSDDAFPLDNTESVDTDGDGIGNNLDTDDDNDGVVDGEDAFPLDNTESVDTDGDGIGNNRDSDDDNDGVADSEDAFPLDNSESVDTDGDGIGNNRDSDDDNDGVVDSDDAFPLDNSESVDTDRDGVGNNRDTDDDNDGVVDSEDAFPLDNTESIDSDGDGIGNNRDTDDDNDGVVDTEDAFPLDNTESVDTDGDGIGNNRDTDDDNDGVVDSDDAFPLDNTESIDTDRDGIGNNRDTDDDNDGVVDSEDAFPLDNTESVDTDGDGIGNNRDTDDDNDGVVDTEDAFPLDNSESVDTDRDGIGNNRDTDDDNDGVVDSDDAFPLDNTESVDTDGDGIGNNRDTDDDNDGVVDSEDAFPLDATESVDTDGDGIGNNRDSDDDNDGVVDSEDAFPLDNSESVDTDRDGIGNNRDTDDDNDGVVDSDDAFPLDATESVDTDGDGIGNNRDTDDDNDGVVDSEDAFPLDNTESVDTDGDGLGNNRDTDDDNDGVVDSEDAFPLDNSESVDTDRDGIGNNRDTDDDNDGVVDSDDAFPLDNTESVDTDGDGIGNNRDSDDDNDGVVDTEDAFPLDNTESVDTDRDGIGNNRDTDDDNDGVVDSDDAFPLDNTESVDTDGDGIGNNRDTDDDNDGILDDEDSSPLDPENGDNQAPVITPLEALSFEAEGVTTVISLPVPEVTDNNLNAPTIVSDLSQSLALGEHLVTWTATDFAGNQSQATQLVTIVDTTAPEFDPIANIVVNATGRVTDISNIVDVSAFDLVDGELQATVIGNSRLGSGRHQVEIGVTDSTGNQASSVIQVDIVPGVSISPRFMAEAGASIEVPVRLTGPAVQYPVVVSYEVLINEQPAISAVSAEIASGTSDRLLVEIPSWAEESDEVRIELVDATNSYVSPQNIAYLNIVTNNIKPRLRITKRQNNKRVNVISTSNGDVTLKVDVNDANTRDKHIVEWFVVNNDIPGITIKDSGSLLSFDPENLDPGRYIINVRVTESNTEELFSVSRRIRLKLVDSIELDKQLDDDNDGIANYLDRDSHVGRLPIVINGEPMFTLASYSLAIGDVIQQAFGTESEYASISMTAFTEAVEPNSAAVIDNHYFATTPIYNFKINDLIEVGESVSIVIPLTEQLSIPDSSVYRKYDGEFGWFDFVVDSKNAISTATSDEFGQCPPLGSSAYRRGLNAEDNCIQLRIEDGGPNDSDKQANGTISDPGAVFVEVANQAPVINLPSQYYVNEQTQVIIDASNTTDEELDPLSFTWQQVSGPQISFVIEQQNKLVFITPTVANTEQSQLITLSLVVDDGGNKTTKIINVNVAPVNTAPVVMIASHLASYQEQTSIMLLADVTDSDGDQLSYSWRQVSGIKVAMTNVETAQPTLILPDVTSDQKVSFEVAISDGEYVRLAQTTLTITNKIAPEIEEQAESAGGAVNLYLLVVLIYCYVFRCRRYLLHIVANVRWTALD